MMTYLVINAEQRLQLQGLFRDKTNTIDVPVVSITGASEIAFIQPGTEKGPVATSDLFATLADTHKLDPDIVRALAKDLLEKLAAGDNSPVSETPALAHLELLPAWPFSPL